MEILVPVNHLHFAPSTPYYPEYNPSAAGRIPHRDANKSTISDPRPKTARWKTTHLTMNDVRANGSMQYAMNDAELAKRAITRLRHDRSPDTTGTAGAASEITIQQDRNVTGTRVKWGLVSSVGLLALQTLGFV